MAKMLRLEKLDGVGNVRMMEAEVPSPGPGEVLLKVRRSLISRGSELFRRYVMPGAVPPRMMGYSDAGDVVEVGPGRDGRQARRQVERGRSPRAVRGGRARPHPEGAGL